MSLRLFARELLNDSFLQIDDLRSLEYRRELDELGPLIRQPYPELHFSSTSYHNSYETLNEWGYHLAETELFKHQEDEHAVDLDISIKGKTRYDGGICLRLWIADKDVLDWRTGQGVKETPRFVNFCHDCATNRTSTSSLFDFLTQNAGIKGSQSSLLFIHNIVILGQFWYKLQHYLVSTNRIHIIFFKHFDSGFHDCKNRSYSDPDTQNSVNE
ncbi:hypothetical protein GOBAR_DD05751 [Gossypium barbadense]|nr:hypothetical protein GOBAR_DD05751 [Gossypium barbadense]